MSIARPPEGAHTAAEGEGTPVITARPPEGAHTAAEGEGTPVITARPPEGAHTAAEGEGTPVITARPPQHAHTVAEGEGTPVSTARPPEGGTPMSGFFNDGSADAPKLRVYLNLDTLLDLRADSLWSHADRLDPQARDALLARDGFEGVQRTDDGPAQPQTCLPHCGASRLDQPPPAPAADRLAPLRSQPHRPARAGRCHRGAPCRARRPLSDAARRHRPGRRCPGQPPGGGAADGRRQAPLCGLSGNPPRNDHARPVAHGATGAALSRTALERRLQPLLLRPGNDLRRLAGKAGLHGAHLCPHRLFARAHRQPRLHAGADHR